LKVKTPTHFIGADSPMQRDGLVQTAFKHSLACCKQQAQAPETKSTKPNSPA
jgi:hypothetical protein